MAKETMVMQDGFIDATEALVVLPTPKAHSLCDILSQGLASRDEELLRRALSCGDKDLQQHCLRRLLPIHILPLLELLIQRINQYPRQTDRLVPWLRALLSVHAAYLTGVPDLSDRLADLHKIIDARTKTYRRMVQLKGRIDMMMEQAQERDGLRRGPQEQLALLMTTPMATYDESEDEDATEIMEDISDEEDDDDIEEVDDDDEIDSDSSSDDDE